MSNDKSFFRSVFSLKVILPLIVVCVGIAAAWGLIATRPVAKKRPPAAIRPTVEVATLVRGPHQVWVPVMGTVVAAREISLKAQVSGKVASINPSFVPGGFFAKGETILTISPEDYKLALEQVKSEVADAEYDLKLEQGYQNVSAREWDLLKGTAKEVEGDSDLALRKPHLAKAKAGLEAAKAKLEAAELDLARTRVGAPFAAMVESKSVDVGATITISDTLATLIGTDEFWIEASVPVDRLNWINIPGKGQAEGSVVRITDGTGAAQFSREGRVIHLLPSLETEGRMARVLVSVKDPLNLEGAPGLKPLLLGSYVSLNIDGGTLGNVISIPRSALRDNNRVWVLNAKGTLDIRTVTPVWRAAEYVLVEDGVETGDLLVTSDIAAPLEGMALQTVDEVGKDADGTSRADDAKPMSKGGEQNNG